MGAKQSSNTPRIRTYSTSGGSSGEVSFGGSSGGGANGRLRARSLGNFASGHSSSLSIPSASGGINLAGTPDSDSSTPEGHEGLLTRAFTHSLPVHLFALQGIKCPVCSKYIPPEDIECHLVICLTKPRITYNEDVLSLDQGECPICLEEMEQGDTIARLPCLCIYHKPCIDKWFEKNRSCPEHPTD